MEVVPLPIYERQVRKLLTTAEREKAEREIAAAPVRWPVVPDAGGARKARVARGGRGKSGGARVIYYVLVRGDRLYLMDIYGKSAKEDLTDADKSRIRETVAAIEAEAQSAGPAVD